MNWYKLISWLATLFVVSLLVFSLLIFTFIVLILNKASAEHYTFSYISILLVVVMYVPWFFTRLKMCITMLKQSYYSNHGIFDN